MPFVNDKVLCWLRLTITLHTGLCLDDCNVNSRIKLFVLQMNAHLHVLLALSYSVTWWHGIVLWQMCSQVKLFFFSLQHCSFLPEASLTPTMPTAVSLRWLHLSTQSNCLSEQSLCSLPMIYTSISTLILASPPYDVNPVFELWRCKWILMLLDISLYIL